MQKMTSIPRICLVRVLGQAVLFPDCSPLLDELKYMDVNSLSPIEALNRLFEWQRKYTKP